MGIEDGSLQRSQEWDRRHPFCSITIQVLPHCVRRMGPDGGSVWHCETKGASRDAYRQPANCEDDNEHAPERLPVLRELMMP